MRYNYWLAKKQFDEAWDKQRIEYEDAGMPKADIEVIYQLDLEAFRKERAYLTHTLPLEPKYMRIDTDMPDKTCMAKRYTAALTIINHPFEHEISSIPNTTENPKMQALFRRLENAGIRLILLLDKGYTQEEIAARLGISQPAVSKRIAKIKNFWNEVIKQALPTPWT